MYVSCCIVFASRVKNIVNKLLNVTPREIIFPPIAIVKGGSVIGTGFNKDRNHPDIVSPEHIKTHCSVHAEVEAIRDAGWNVKGAVLYVARVNAQGKDRNSKPCDRCSVVIEETLIKKVIYTGSDYVN